MSAVSYAGAVPRTAGRCITCGNRLVERPQPTPASCDVYYYRMVCLCCEATEVLHTQQRESGGRL